MLYLKPVNITIMEAWKMLFYDSSSYDAMLGKIGTNLLDSGTTMISQCTGCMCNCRCSCSGGIISDFEWEVM